MKTIQTPKPIPHTNSTKTTPYVLDGETNEGNGNILCFPPLYRLIWIETRTHLLNSHNLRLALKIACLCYTQESQDQAIYYDAHVVEIQRKMHDIRGCRCIFLVRYNHDNTEASENTILIEPKLCDVHKA